MITYESNYIIMTRNGELWFYKIDECTKSTVLEEATHFN